MRPPKIAKMLLESYLPLIQRSQQNRIARQLVSKTAKMVRKQEHTRKLLLTSEAFAGYQTLIEPGERVLASDGEDPELVAEIQGEQDTLQERLDDLDDQMSSLVESHSDATTRRKFWSSEMDRLSQAMHSDHVLVHQYGERWNNGAPEILNTIRKVYKTREEKRDAKRAIERLKQEYILPELQAERQRAKDLAAQLEPYEAQKRDIQAEIDSWGEYYTDPEVYAKEYVRFARYWRDFLRTVDNGGKHYKPLANIPANPPLLRYRRAKMRIIFRRVGDVIHVLRIATRSDDTYSSLKHLITESDRNIR